jgi:LuxR family transcriptional regulator, quorum-sensing system regulator CciR
MLATEFEAQVQTFTRLEDVWAALVEYAGRCGVRRIAYHHLPPAAAPDSRLLRIENSGFGEVLLHQYLAAREAGIAVLATVIQNSVRPVYLDELEALVDLSPRERSHIEGYRRAGVESGLGVQVFGPNGRNGILAVDLEPGVRRLAPEVLAGLRWACQSMHLRYCELLVPMLGKMPALSAREAEVLTWAARGKSNAAIGEILGISAHTVDAHLRRVYLKLGVFDRMSAALRGLGFGLIAVDG